MSHTFVIKDCFLIRWEDDNCNTNTIEIPARCFTCEYKQKNEVNGFTARYGDSRCYDLSNYSPFTSMSSLSTNCPLDHQYCVTEVLENKTKSSLKRYCSNEDKTAMHEASDEDSGRDN